MNLYNQNTKEYNVCIVGDGGVGKTTFLYNIGSVCTDTENKCLRLTSHYFFDTKNGRRGLNILDLVDNDNEKFSKDCWDRADGFIILFDSSRPQAYQNGLKWIENVRTCCGQDIPVVLIGTKGDLVDISTTQSEFMENLTNIIYYRGCIIREIKKMNFDSSNEEILLSQTNKMLYDVTNSFIVSNKVRTDKPLHYFVELLDTYHAQK